MKVIRKASEEKSAGLKKLVRFAPLLLGALLFFSVLICSYWDILPQKLKLREGDVAAENIIAPRRIVDTKMTQALKKQAQEMVEPIYDYIPSAYVAAQEQLDNFISAISALSSETIDEAMAKSLNSVHSVNLTAENYNYLKNMSAGDYENLYRTASEFLKNAFEGSIRADKFSETLTEILSGVDELDTSEEKKTLLRSLLSGIIRPNQMLNEDATAAARQNAWENVYEVVYDAGQTIINRGEIVTAHQIELLQDNGMLASDGMFSSAASALGQPLLLGLIILVYMFYLKIYVPRVFGSVKLLLLLVLQIIASIVTAKICGYFSGYLIPSAMLTMCICMLFDSRLAVSTDFFVGLLLAVALQLDIDTLIYLLISGCIGIYYLRSVSSRTDIFKSGLLVACANVLCALILAVFRSNLTGAIIPVLCSCVGGGILAALGTTGLVMMWELLFNVATPLKLLELSSPSSPLIQKLVTSAAGTYYHSLIVGNMSEAAAKAIGADPLLARVGAYYHDIGKSENPEYFSENQRSCDNPHDLLAPEVSAKIIKNHVTEGEYLAGKYRVPPDVSIFISTHHGTSEITYFKFKAQKAGYEGAEDFRYHGNLPISRETSIVMLADSVEAAVKSLSAQSERNIREMIDKIITKKDAEGQLAQSRLSYEQMEQVKAAFLEILEGVYHSRVKYPDQED